MKSANTLTFYNGLRTILYTNENVDQRLLIGRICILFYLTDSSEQTKEIMVSDRTACESVKSDILKVQAQV